MALLNDSRGTWLTQVFTDNTLQSPSTYIGAGIGSTTIFYFDYTGAAANTVLDIIIYGDYTGGDWYTSTVYVPDGTTGINTIIPSSIRISGAGNKKMIVPFDTTGMNSIKCTLQVSSGTAVGTSLTIKYVNAITKEMGERI